MLLAFVFMVAFLLARSTAIAFQTRTSIVVSRRVALQTTSAVAMSSSSSQLYWNREESVKQNYKSSAPILKQANIISLSAVDDDANSAVNTATSLPNGATLLAIGSELQDFDIPTLKQQNANVIFVAHPKV